jgi:hypothetical protein
LKLKIIIKNYFNIKMQLMKFFIEIFIKLVLMLVRVWKVIIIICLEDGRIILGFRFNFRISRLILRKFIGNMRRFYINMGR